MNEPPPPIPDGMDFWQYMAEIYIPWDLARIFAERYATETTQESTE